MNSIRESIALMVAPVVMISACGLLCLALYNRLAAVVARARMFLKERFDMMRKLSSMGLDEQASTDAHVMRQRLMSVDEMVDRIIARARLLRAALTLLLTGVLCMLGCTLLLGLTLVAPVEKLVLTVFIVGVVTMAGGIVLAIVELFRALDPLHLEHEAVSSLGEP